jgi:hypothetical protein
VPSKPGTSAEKRKAWFKELKRRKESAKQGKNKDKDCDTEKEADEEEEDEEEDVWACGQKSWSSGGWKDWQDWSAGGWQTRGGRAREW